MTPRWPSDSSPFSVAAAETPAETDRPGHTGEPGRSSIHKFVPHVRFATCARCGKAKDAPEHGNELRRTTVIGHLNLAIKSLKEDDPYMCAIHVGTAQKILEGDD